MFNDNFLIFAILAVATIGIIGFSMFESAQETKRMVACLERPDHQWMDNTCKRGTNDED